MTSLTEPIPRKTAAWGIALFVLSLAILFASSMLAYFVIRLQHTENAPVGSLALPRSLWISTAIIVLSSVTISRALAAVKLERQAKLRRYLLWTLVLAVAFVALQSPALIHLLVQHDVSSAAGNRLYGILFTLILLHALHVVGGLVFLGMVIYGTYHLRYDHEHYIGVRNLTVYWHFLDVVWLFMFFSLSAVG